MNTFKLAVTCAASFDFVVVISLVINEIKIRHVILFTLHLIPTYIYFTKDILRQNEI